MTLPATQHRLSGGAPFRQCASNDAVCIKVPRQHPSRHPTVAAATARAANDACAPLLFDAGEWSATVTATLDAAGEFHVVAWIPPAEPAPMRRCREAVPVDAPERELPNWRALFAAAGFSMHDADEDDDSDDDSAALVLAAAPVQRVVLAEQVAPTARRPGTPGPLPRQRPIMTSVFDLAKFDLRIVVGTGAATRAVQRNVTRGEGFTRVVAIREQDTAAWAEKDRQRRARQRPPRPPRGAKTRSKKLEALIGEQA